MPDIIVRELANSRRFSISPPEGEIRYVAFRSNTESEIATAVAGVTPAYIAGLRLKAVEFDPQGGGVWFVTCKYGLLDGPVTPAQGGAEAGPPPGSGGTSPPPAPPPPAVTESGALYDGWAFSISGGTEHITQSLQTRYRSDAAGINGAGNAPDFQGAIGVVKGQGPQGTEVRSGGLTFSTTRKLQAISFGYIKTLSRLAFTTNGATFWTCTRGELLFTGATGTYKGPEGWEITYNFEFHPSEADFDEGFEGLTAFPDVRGHDYIWVAYADGESNDRPVQTPIAAYCERVYPESDFSLLGLGV